MADQIPARLEVNVGTEPAAALRDYMDRHDVSATEAIRRAISVLKFVDDELGKGGRMAIHSLGGRVQFVEFPDLDAASSTREEK